jgi:hypothetical protein
VGRAAAPLLQVIRGDPSTEELAALLAVVAAYAAPAADGPPPITHSPWSDPAAALRRPLALGSHAWMTSGWQSGVRTRAAW